MTLSGNLHLDGVEDLAACADEICRSAVQVAVFDVAGLTAVDEAGARTLAAVFRCLAAHGVAGWVRGVGGELQLMLDRLDLTVPEPPAPSEHAMVAARATAVAASPSAGLLALGVAFQGAAGGLGAGYAGHGDGGHDRVELPSLLRADAVKQLPPDLLDV